MLRASHRRSATPRTPGAAQSQAIRRHWRTVQDNLQSQCWAEPRGPWIRQLIAELDQRLHWHLALQPWHRELPRFRLLQRLRNLLALLPLEASLQQAGKQMLHDLNQEALAQLDRHLAPATSGLVVMVTGCRSRSERMASTIQRFSTAAAGTRAAVLGVVGDPALRDWELRFDHNSGVLRLPINDAYEALPHKVAWAALALALVPRPLAMLKVDDDAAPADLGDSVRLLNTLQQGHQAAAGYPITTPSPLSLDRGWHLGKSSRRANRISFSNLATRNWMSGGTGYLLAPAGVGIVAEYALHSWGFFETMLYEDIGISMVLKAADAQLLWLDQASSLGIHTERADEIEQGLWPYDREMLVERPC